MSTSKKEVSSESVRDASEWRVYDPKDIGAAGVYSLGISAVVPRPIAVITTTSSLEDDGILNCAPYSYTGLMSHDPPLISHGLCLSKGVKKDTLVNIEKTKSWVYNVLSDSYLESANACSEALPSDIDELQHSGLSTLPSTLIHPPRIKEARVSMECVLESLNEVLNDDGVHTTTIVLGRVVKYHIHKSVLIEKNNDPKRPIIDLQKLRACGRVGGISYWPTGEGKEVALPRP